MRIAWLCLQGFGDALMTTPAMRRLRDARPDAEIHAVALRAPVHGLLSELPTIDRAHYLPYWEGRLLETIRGVLRLRGAFDVTILAYPSVRREYHLVAATLGAPRRIAHDYRPYALSFAPLENERVAILADEHNVVNNLGLLAPLGIETGDPPPRYELPPGWRDGGERRNEVAFHLGTMMHKGNENKRWPLERFIAVGRALRAQGVGVAAIDGPMERSATAAFADAVEGVRVLAGDLRTVAQALAGMRALVAADNGIAHLAAAVDTPAVTLFGLTDPRRVRPWGPRAVVVRPSPCPPCFSFGDATFDCKRNIDFACLRTDLTVEHVTRALDTVLHAPAVAPA